MEAANRKLPASHLIWCAVGLLAIVQVHISAGLTPTAKQGLHPTSTVRSLYQVHLD